MLRIASRGLAVHDVVDVADGPLPIVADPRKFASHPFWAYSLRIYARPGVDEACLELQDEFDLDVNLVLLCLWAGAEGPGRLTGEELAECRARGGRWQREVVQRMRHVRRTLKQDQLGATAELVGIFRPRVQKLELDAEHVEQLLLAGILPLARGETGSAAAVDNLRAYFEASGVAPGGASRAAVLTVLENAFADREPGSMAALWDA